MTAIALDLDAVLGDTRPLWHDFLADCSRRFAAIALLEPDTLSEDRGLAAAELDAWAAAGVGDWRAALQRFAEDRAPLYLRPRPDVSAALRALAAQGVRIGAFTDAPQELANVALAHTGTSRRIELLECGLGARERLAARFGPETRTLESPELLVSISRDGE